MKLHTPVWFNAGRTDGKRRANRPIAALAAVLLAGALSACHDATPASRALYVRTEVVRPSDRHTSVTLTGEVQARFRADLSFRVNGRVLARYADVGAHVEAGEVLARLDPAEPQADLDAALAAEAAAVSQLRLCRLRCRAQRSPTGCGPPITNNGDTDGTRD